MHTTKQTLLLLAMALLAGLGGGVLARQLDPAPVRAAPTRVAPPPAWDVVAMELAEKIETLEKRVTREPGPSSKPTRAPDSKPPSASASASVEEFATQPYTRARSQRFFARLGKQRDAIASTIEQLQAAIAKDPTNPHLHAALGTAYSAKTAFMTPPGPEQGTVWAQAERAFAEAIRLDPEHWEAHYSLAFGDSMAPEFVGLRPRAIERFETLMKIQERQPAHADHVLVYMRLGTLHKDAGNTKRARAIWERGVDRFPEDEQLARALALLGED
ncbi:MAG: tetratricopeptide repeat protein [Planctomycetota bacterium]